MKTNALNSESFVRARHRAAQWAPLLGVIAAGLALTLGLLWLVHPSTAPVADWRPLRHGWLACLGIMVVFAAVLWRERRRTLARSAAEMDAALATHNRLETATALRDAQDAMARAQRAETEQFLQESRMAPRGRWLSFSAALVALFAAGHLATLICWSRPVREVARAKSSPPVAEATRAESSALTASIEWRSPESETSATAIEEVPLEAEADSSTGLRNVMLEVEVNGAHRLSQPLANDLARPGRHTLKPSLYLDQLEVKTYDIVSYHLDAQRIAGSTLPPTVSPVQFVQVKPVREDTFVCAGGDQPSKCFNYVTALKAAQLRLMKDNFTLAHAEVSRDNNEWLDQNSRVGGEQKQLTGRADEVITLMTTNHYPEQILSLVRLSQPLMSDAAAKIARQENQPALGPQGQALGYLTEVEKYLQNTIKLAGQNTQPNANDPFQQPKNLDLKTHPLTRAGKMDALARAQSQLAGDLAGGSSNATVQLATEDGRGDDITGTPGERQARIKERIGGFLGDSGVTADALKHLQSSDDFAGRSLERIKESDFAAASEPAAEAARELQQTAAALRAGGNQAARNKLADALLQLAAAAGNVRRAPHAQTDAEAAAELMKTEAAVREAARQLAAEAQRQQENGATNAAARLGDMARLLQGESLKQMLAQAQAAPRDGAQNEALAKKLDDLADQAGQQRDPGPMSRSEVARLVDRLQRTQANLNNLASQSKNAAASPTGGAGKSGPGSRLAGASGSGGLTADEPPRARGPEPSRADLQRAEGAELLDELRLGGMEARGAGADMIYVKKLERVLSAAAERPSTEPQDYAPLVLEIDPLLTGVINSLQTKLAGMRRQFDLAADEPAAAPPAYREAVADYFERVSRDYEPAKSGQDDAH